MNIIYCTGETCGWLVEEGKRNPVTRQPRKDEEGRCSSVIKWEERREKQRRVRAEQRCVTQISATRNLRTQNLHLKVDYLLYNSVSSDIRVTTLKSRWVVYCNS